MYKYFDIEEFHSIAKDGGKVDDDTVVCRTVATKVNMLDGAPPQPAEGSDSPVVTLGEPTEGSNNKIEFVISTGDMDRDNDTINVAGWELTNYMKNPVVLWAHQSKDLPVARALSLSFSDTEVKSLAEFASKDVYEFAHTVYKLYAGKFLNTVSVGFLPKEWEWNDETGGVDFSKQELLEYSAVPVPSNPNAFVIARSKGIDTNVVRKWAMEILDGEDKKGLWLPKGVLEEVYKQADSKGSVSVRISKAEGDETLTLEIEDKEKGGTSSEESKDDNASSEEKDTLENSDVSSTEGETKEESVSSEDSESKSVEDEDNEGLDSEDKDFDFDLDEDDDLLFECSEEELKQLINEETQKAINAITGKLD